MTDFAPAFGSQARTGDAGEPLRAAASWDVVHRPTTAGAFPARVAAVHRAVRSLEFDLARLSKQPASRGSAQAALQELRANARMLRSAVGGLEEIPRVVSRLPRVVVAGRQDEPRAAAVAAAYLRTANDEFTATSFQEFMSALQAHEPLTLDELWNISSFLKFVLVESLVDNARALLRTQAANAVPSVSIRLKSLLAIGTTNWTFLIEPLIVFDATLRQDPAGTYAAMDFESREQYRKRVALIARYSDCTEAQVAQAVVNLAREGERRPADNPRIQRRRIHVGYYLLDRGFVQLATRVEYHPRVVDRLRTFVRAHADDFYISGIEVVSILFMAVLLFPVLSAYSAIGSLAAVLFFMVLPVTQCAVDLVNNSVTSLFDPEPLPKLDFSCGIPAEFTTMVVVPTLLLSEKQVRELVNDLEVRFLANRDPHLHFALLTDLPDSAAQPRAHDSDPLADLAVQLINGLDAKYSSSGKGAFVLLHRRRIFNVRQNVWMGWERKRGKLLDLNKLLRGDIDAFPIKAGRLDVLSQVRYVLTLDSDTQLPRGSAARLIGAIAHPLNQAVIHPESRVVVSGYGILQPRIGVSVHSASRSRLAAIYSGQSGFDIYTRAVSDAYQDLYGEGSFTGKGIYEVATFHEVMDNRFPRNSLLSHDLIEGAYARAGLATDIELIDDYPSHLSAYSRRKHRWVRGDWQIAQWMFARVPDESRRWSPNPISTIARWKIFDNLRRSLVEPFTFMLLLAGWLGLPAGPLYWTVVLLVLLFFPTLVQLAFALSRALLSGRKGGAGEAFTGFVHAATVTFVNFIFLPYQTLLSFDAIVRALVRRFITGDRLLEWETAAQAESRSGARTAVDRYLSVTPLVAIAVAILVYICHPHGRAIIVAAPILLLWALANPVTSWLNAPPREQNQRLGSTDESYLRCHALRIWRYFHQFGGERHNYLIPDNVEEAGMVEAPRVSPTNIGLLLNARQAACEFGFLTVPEFAALTDRSLATIAKLEKHRGHLLNWYDTQTLQPLGDAPFVSSVDSGNFVASLYTLHAGALELSKRPLITVQLFNGLRVHWQMTQAEKQMPAPLGKITLPAPDAKLAQWIAWLETTAPALARAADLTNGGDRWWLIETQHRAAAIQALLHDSMPWLLPQYGALSELPALAFARQQSHVLTLEQAAAYAENLESELANGGSRFSRDANLDALCAQLRASLPAAARNLRALSDALRDAAQRAERFAEDTEFAFLADPGRRILSIGYDVRAQKIHSACYDMLASEARVATFLAIARDELPQQSWFKLGRDHTQAFGQFILHSWTGTMFEYLMPALWMRNYPDTLISRTLEACVRAQRAFAGSFNIPWGISESGNASRNDSGHYGYLAYGIPQTAVFTDATAGPVISPYSSFLALGIDSLSALRNLRRMSSAGWVGAYGFYEAADFIASTAKPTLVREWMAHHQGMSLLAVLNLLHEGAAQRWFHANPLVQATELLLHELPVSDSVLRAKLQESAPIRAAA